MRKGPGQGRRQGSPLARAVGSRARAVSSRARAVSSRARAVRARRFARSGSIDGRVEERNVHDDRGWSVRWRWSLDTRRAEVLAVTRNGAPSRSIGRVDSPRFCAPNELSGHGHNSPECDASQVLACCQHGEFTVTLPSERGNLGMGLESSVFVDAHDAPTCAA